MLGVKERVLLFDTLAAEEVVLRLLHQWADEVKAGGDAVGAFDFVGVPFARAPVEG